MPPEIARKRRQDPLQAVKEQYGSVEEFAVTVLDVCPGYLEGDYGTQEAAEALDLPHTTFLKAVNDPKFHEMLDQLASLTEYSYQKRRLAMRNLTQIATTAQKLTITRSGKPVTVERDAEEIIKADTHLRKVQGRPLEKEKTLGGGGVTIIFGGAEPNDTETITVEARNADDDPKDHYQPAQLGALPPSGARRFYGDDEDGEKQQATISPEFDFNNEETQGPKGTGSVAAAKDLGKRKDEQ